MKKPSIFALALAFTVLMTMTEGVQAKGSKKSDGGGKATTTTDSPPAEPKPKAVPKPVPPKPEEKPDLVSAVDVAKHTITISFGKGGNPIVYTLATVSKITINGMDGALADVKPGMKASKICTSSDDLTKLAWIVFEENKPKETTAESGGNKEEGGK